MDRRKVIEFLESYRDIIVNPDEYSEKELESNVQKVIEDYKLDSEKVWRNLE